LLDSLLQETTDTMAKYYNTEHRHPYSWEQVSRAIFQRYPNPFASHVLSEDTVYREIINGTVLYSRRFFTKTNKIPKWGERWLSGFAKRVPLVEESFVDSANRTITTYTRNVGHANFMTVAEKVVYKECPDNPNQTIAVKEAWVESRFYGLRTAIKNFGIERFKMNCVKATAGFNHVLESFQQRQQELQRIGQEKIQEFQHIKQEKIEEFQHIKDSIKTQYREKAESLKEKSSQQWTQAKDTAVRAKESAKDTAVRARDTAKETAERARETAISLSSLHAAEMKESEQSKVE